jgi:hypothetical protein
MIKAELYFVSYEKVPKGGGLSELRELDGFVESHGRNFDDACRTMERTARKEYGATHVFDVHEEPDPNSNRVVRAVGVGFYKPTKKKEI